jgi:acetyl esterase/lipase
MKSQYHFIPFSSPKEQHKYPTAINECIDLCFKIFSEEITGKININAMDRFYLFDDSAGGSIISGQILVYPITQKVGDTPSYAKYKNGFILNARMIEWFISHYINIKDKANIACNIICDFLNKND